jgi:hypothetical protein
MESGSMRIVGGTSVLSVYDDRNAGQSTGDHSLEGSPVPRMDDVGSE